MSGALGDIEVVKCLLLVARAHDITHLPTNRLNNKYIFRPRSVVCVREGKKTRLLPSLTHTLRGLTTYTRVRKEVSGALV